jgi:DNA-binding MarR family transcriptional regulator
LASHDQHTHNLLSAIERGGHVSQRSLAKNLGIALGLTNLILRRVVRKGWVRMVHVRPNRVRYLLTPTGIAEKARMSRDSLKYSIRLYTETRDRIRDQIAAVAERSGGIDHRNGKVRIVFLGAGELAEIGYVCLQETDLQLVGVIGDNRRSRFFDVPIHPVTDLCGQRLGGEPFDWLLVMSLDDRQRERTAATLAAAGVPRDRVHWL